MEKKTKQDHIFDAKQLARSEHSGVLSTHSLSVKGYPFGSVIPYMMTQRGELILYASDIAQHSRNMKTAPKVSMCLYDGTKDDSQTNARVTVLGEAQVLGPVCEYAHTYFSLFPQARAYVEAHDFQFYKITPERIRYIGGFGEIYWFSADEWSGREIEWQDEIDGMTAHMHEDHADALALMLNAQHNTDATPGSVLMCSLFSDGFHVQFDGRFYFIKFPENAISTIDVRKAMVHLTQQARDSDHANFHNNKDNAA